MSGLLANLLKFYCAATMIQLKIYSNSTRNLLFQLLNTSTLLAHFQPFIGRWGAPRHCSSRFSPLTRTINVHTFIHGGGDAAL